MTNLAKRISPTALFLLVVLIIMAVLFVASISYSDMKVKLMPSLISGLTILLTLIALLQDIKSGFKETLPTDEDGDVIEDEKILATPLRAYFKYFLWFAALIAMVYLIGFIVAIPIWISVYLWKQGNPWWKGIPHGIALTVIVYVVFTMVLQIELYRGVIGEWLVKLLEL